MTDPAPVIRLRPDETELLGQAAGLLPEPIFVVDVVAGERLRVVAANNAAITLLGPGASGRFVDELPAANQPDRIAAEIARCIKSGAATSFEEPIRDPRGQRVLRITLTPVRAASGRLHRVMGAGRDITDEKAAETRLNLLEHALDEVPQAVYLFDQEGRIRYSSAEAVRALGFSPVELLGLTVSDLDPEWPRAAWDEVKRRGTLTVRGTHRRKDRTTFPVEVVATHIEFEGQEYIIANVHETTERLRIEAELHARAEEFRALVENSPDVVIRYDRQCRRTYANPAYLHLAGAIEPYELLGRTPTELNPVLSRPSAYEAKLRQALTTGKPQETLLHGTGTRGPFWHHARFVPERDTEGKVTSVLAISHEVTALLEAQQSLRHRNRELHALSKCNQSLIRAEDEQVLLHEICRIICDDAGYRLAWAGYAMHDPGKSIRAVAAAGADSGYVAEAKLSWDAESPGGQGPAGIAIRTGEAVIVQDFDTDPRMAHWRAGAARHGYRSGIALPLRNDEATVFGVMLIYAAEPEAITPDEARLLGELARDLSFGIMALRNRQHRRETEAALRESEQKFRAIFHNSPLGLFRSTFEGRFLEVNPAFAAMFGYDAPATMVREITDIASRVYADPQTRAVVVREQLAAPDTTRHQVRFRRKDGSEFPVNLYLKTIRDAEGAPLFMEGIVEDITERRHAEVSMQRLNRALKTLSSGNEALVRAESESELLEKMCRVVVEVGGYRFAWIGFAAGEEVEPRAVAGVEEGFLAARRPFDEQDPAAIALRSGATRVIHDEEQVSAAFGAQLQHRGFRACAAFPLNAGDGKGVLAIYSADPDAFDADEVRLLTELSQDLAFGIRALRIRVEREHSLAQLQASMASTIEALANTVELRDPYTAGHQRRVSRLATHLARRLGLSGERVHAVYLAGMVHDVGKVAVPAEILSKPGRLTEAELMLVRWHADAGYEILKGVDFSWPIARMVHQHHERLDGSGYPLGLKGDEILMEARILAVCDVVEAMSNHRPYRAALGIEKALAEIARGRGVLYDATVVDACMEMFREQRGMPDEWHSAEVKWDLATPLP